MMNVRKKKFIYGCDSEIWVSVYHLKSEICGDGGTGHSYKLQYKSYDTL